MSRFYVTTPIYYVSDVPHVGNSYTTIAADVLRRYQLLRGKASRMLTGTDEHGLKIEREAQARGIPPAQFVKEMSDRFEAAWPRLEVRADDFIRTTEARHERLVQELWRTIEKAGDLYLGEYEDWYCVGCESYKTEKELLPGNVCALHLKPVERLKEETYFFRLSKYTQKLLDWYREHPTFVEPETRRNEVVSFVAGGLKDLSVSRTSFHWGVPVPGDPKHVMYVWYDALANYWTALQDTEEHRRFWNEGTVIHLVGKDILRFHAVFWPAFLMSAGLRLPDTVFAHGFLTFGGQKMSKSLRNSVDPIGIARAFGEVIKSGEAAGADVLRYQLLRAIAFGQDGDFDLRAMVERYNADLGKNLGNLLARTLGLCAKMTGGKVPPKGEWTPLEKELHAAIDGHRREALAAWDRIEPTRALERTWAIASAANQYVDRAAPWAEDKKGNRARVDTILNTLLSVLGELSTLVWPVLPSKSDEMRKQLGLLPLAPSIGKDWLAAGVEARAAGEDLAPGSPLFPTIDEDNARALVDALTPRAEGGAAAAETAPAAARATAAATETATAAGTASGAVVGYDQFAAVDLRVGVVRTCERVPKKDKLLKLGVDVGEAQPRTIVAGLALSFTPEQLVGRRVVVVANLAPREFGKGLVSHGMLLATGPSERLSLATVEGDVAPGATLK
jgi:methionyl-tRNA synthetase